MSHYLQQEVDFINRTKLIITQYETFQIEEKDKFEVTLYLNCLVGLLILPKQHWYNDLPQESISLLEWGIAPEHIYIIKDGEDKNVKNIATHIRNSISHYRFNAFENSFEKIREIQFKDYFVTNEGKENEKKKMTFHAVIPIQNLRKFTDKLTNTLIEKMEQCK